MCHTETMSTSSPQDATSTTAHTENRKRRPGDVPPGIAAIVAALVAPLIGLLGIVIGRNTANTTSGSNPQPTSTVTATITASPTATVVGKHSNIHIISPQNADRVPQCSIIRGSGRIPVGYTLWIMYSLNDGHAPYWFGAAAVADSTSPSDWSTTSTVGIGDSSRASIGISAELIPVLIRDPWGSFLASKDTDGERDVRSARLPPDSIVLPPDRRVTVTRSAKHGACSAS
jgi:hypothetical protein